MSLWVIKGSGKTGNIPMKPLLNLVHNLAKIKHEGYMALNA